MRAKELILLPFFKLQKHRQRKIIEAHIISFLYAMKNSNLIDFTKD